MDGGSIPPSSTTYGRSLGLKLACRQSKRPRGILLGHRPRLGSPPRRREPTKLPQPARRRRNSAPAVTADSVDFRTRVGNLLGYVSGDVGEEMRLTEHVEAHLPLRRHRRNHRVRDRVTRHEVQIRRIRTNPTREHGHIPATRRLTINDRHIHRHRRHTRRRHASNPTNRQLANSARAIQRPHLQRTTSIKRTERTERGKG